MIHLMFRCSDVQSSSEFWGTSKPARLILAAAAMAGKPTILVGERWRCPKIWVPQTLGFSCWLNQFWTMLALPPMFSETSINCVCLWCSYIIHQAFFVAILGLLISWCLLGISGISPSILGWENQSAGSWTIHSKLNECSASSPAQKDRHLNGSWMLQFAGVFVLVYVYITFHRPKTIISCSSNWSTWYFASCFTQMRPRKERIHH